MKLKPYQMTCIQWYKSENPFRDTAEWIVRNKLDGYHRAAAWLKSGAPNIDFPFPSIDYRVHKALVREAIRTGKTIPATVFVQYPDLLEDYID